MLSSSHLGTYASAQSCGLAVCLLVDLLVLGRFLELWFGERGLLPLEAAFTVIDEDTIPLFKWFPRSWPWVRLCYFLFLGQAVLLLLGVRSRFQALCAWGWLTIFQCRNILVVDGGETVLRLLAFFLCLLPCGAAYGVDASRARTRGEPPAVLRPAWALPLVQIEMTLIYVSTAWEKLNGDAWIDGTAVYTVARLDDNFGPSALAALFLQHLPVSKAVTWLVLAFEVVLPVALWFKETRRYALVGGVLFHLLLDNLMQLFLFEWIMIVGLLSFMSPEELDGILSWITRRRRSMRARLSGSAGPLGAGTGTPSA